MDVPPTLCPSVTHRFSEISVDVIFSDSRTPIPAPLVFLFIYRGDEGLSNYWFSSVLSLVIHILVYDKTIKVLFTGSSDLRNSVV